MASFSKCYAIKKNDFIKAGDASIKIKNLLKSTDIDPAIIRRVAVCGYEGEINVAMHGGNGKICIDIGENQITIKIDDDGPGIEDIDLAMKKGFSTATDKWREMGFGAGMGLPNMFKNADKFNIESEKGNGTHITMEFSLKGNI
ncbi:MAG: anti-sigma regulatory factor [Desulfobacterales bacterium]|nr:anti-sigma regulatory factor [Desulfobacterales bacterium]MCP4164239.1 anti-sigma regulatory factor [Deltaproteobacteria bacterium]